MVRGYFRRSAPVQGEDIKNAIRFYKSNVNPSQRETCDAFGLTRSVFQKYLKINPNDIPKECSQGRHGVFTKDMEEEILSYIYMLANRFHAITRQSLAELVYQLAERNHLEHPFKDGRAGDGWVTSFLERHSNELSLRTGTPLSLIRITSFKRQAVYRFFDILEEIVSAKNYNADTIFNMDETGVSIVPSKPPKRIARRGVRSVPVMVPAERGQLCTILCSFSASGVFVPPMFLFPFNTNGVSMDHAPTNAIFSKTAKGWSTSEAFLKWLRHFRKFASATPDIPLLLILDNHSSHVSFQAVSYCRRHHIDLLTLPPHSTHKLQPCDVSFFGPLKSKYSQYLVRWLSERPGRKPRNTDIPSIFKRAYEDACKPDTAINGFQKTGIWQFNTVSQVWGPNRHVYDEEFSDHSDEAGNISENDNLPPPSPPNSPLRSQRYEIQCESIEQASIPEFNSDNSHTETNHQTSEYPSGQSFELYGYNPCGISVERAEVNQSSGPPLDETFGLLPDPQCGPPPDQPLGLQLDPPNGPPMDQPLALDDFPGLPALIPLTPQTLPTKSMPISRRIISFSKSVERPKVDEDEAPDYFSHINMWCMIEPPRYPQSSALSAMLNTGITNVPAPEQYRTESQAYTSNQTTTFRINSPVGPHSDQPPGYHTDPPGGPPCDQPPGYHTDPPGRPPNRPKLFHIESPVGPQSDQPSGYHMDTPGGPPCDQPPGYHTDSSGGPHCDPPPEYHTDPPGGLPCDQPTRFHTNQPGEPIATTSNYSRYISSDSDVGIRTKVVKRRRIVTRKSESQGYDLSSSDEECSAPYALLHVPRQVDTEDILTGSDELLKITDAIDLIVPRGSVKQTFTVRPKEIETLFQFPELPIAETSNRKPRERQSAELMTSNENINKLRQKQARKKAKTSDESSDEPRKTRSISQAEKFILRSGKRVK
ncbi:unnamed protein product [Allacma fusca]|uniref:HTH CENPB-type domain-containing protein n=1 Tax=Allacma fusca TaxID=39272 RepID=A0A8J2K6G4_9HEXA|nr:unnamed protein product [Allacma fusca]